MNVKKMAKIFVVVMTCAISGPVIANTDFQQEVAKLQAAINEAIQAGQLDASEQKTLKKELSEIRALYAEYNLDSHISAQEANTLKVKLKNTDLNIFRKKYN